VTIQQWACAGRLSPTIQGLALLGVDLTALHQITFLHKQSIHVAVGKQHGGKSVAFDNSVFKWFIGINNLNTFDTAFFTQIEHPI
jgi:hypothetical protein